MCAVLTLEIYFKPGAGSQEFAEREAQNLRDLVHQLAPHVALTVTTNPIEAAHCSHQHVPRDGTTYSILNHEPHDQTAQTLVITSEAPPAAPDGPWGGYAWKDRGCLFKTQMEASGCAVDVTIHEWLHTIVEHTGICPDSGPPPGCYQRVDGHWYDWYRHILEQLPHCGC